MSARALLFPRATSPGELLGDTGVLPVNDGPVSWMDAASALLRVLGYKGLVFLEARRCFGESSSHLHVSKLERRRISFQVPLDGFNNECADGCVALGGHNAQGAARVPTERCGSPCERAPRTPWYTSCPRVSSEKRAAYQPKEVKAGTQPKEVSHLWLRLHSIPWCALGCQVYPTKAAW